MVELVREFGPIIDQIDWSLLPEPEKLRVSSYRPSTKVYASGIKDCSRQWYYKLSKETEPHYRMVTKPEWNLAAAYGNAIHDMIQQELENYDLIKNAELPLPDLDHYISARRDGELTTRKGLLEIKTVNAAAWTKVPHSDKFLGWQDQIQVYLQELDLPEALLIVVRRDPIVERKTATIRKSLCKEFIIKRDRVEGQRLINKALKIREAVEEQIVPDAEPGDGCFFCAYQHLCELQDVKDSLGKNNMSERAAFLFD
jgi:CRISPR/Cas system-associated exonuclease Cas4 (RecB family)